MRTVTVQCDRCGVEVRQGRLLCRNESGRLRSVRAEVDLCGPCADAFEAWLTAGMQAPTVASDDGNR